MKKALLALTLFGVVVAGCSSNAQVQAGGEMATYLESIDKYDNFTAYTLIHKDSGCKYLVTKSSNYGTITTEQMLGANGMPICE